MKQFWTALLALLLALTVCGCDQQEDPPAPAGDIGDTGSILQHEAEALQPVELTIEESEQCYRVVFADPRDMIYVSDTQATANGAVFHGVLTTETGLLVRSLEVSAPGQLLSSGGDEVDGALGLDAACRVQDTNCYILSVEEGEESRQVLKIRDEIYDISPLEGVHWLFSWEDGLLLVSLDGQICPVSLIGSLGTPTDLGVEVHRACQRESGEILLVSREEALATGEILLLPVSISSAGQYDELSRALGDDLVAVGYPDGGVASFYLRNPVAIPANAKETRAAWAFVQQMVSASYQNFYSGWLSTNESIEETMAEDEAQGVRPESIAAVEALLQSADQAVYYNEDVTNIVLEETAPFFDGAISQDEAIGRIQERVQLYLDEQ